MRMPSVTDCLSCILFRVLSFFIIRLPLGLSFFLGALLGRLICFFDAKHRAVAYSNIKTAFARKFDSVRLGNTVREFYRSFGQSLIEFFIFPSIDKKYIDKYVTFEGLDNIASGFKRGKGVILAVVHEGSWEISNIISANLGYPFNIVVRTQQKYERLNGMLNVYRSQKGSKLIETKNQTRRIIEALKKNEAIGMTLDQGGKNGCLVKFFGKNASMSTGAVRLAMKFGAVIVPVFFARQKGPHIKFFIDRPFEIKETGDSEKDVRENLQRLILIYEKYIAQYPKEYLWTYKIWKYSDERSVLVLSDGRAGHLRQSQGLAAIIGSYLKERNLNAVINTAQVSFKSRTGLFLAALCALFSGKRSCRGCLKCLSLFLEKDSYESVARLKPDIVVSCGSSLSAVNYMISAQNKARSAVIMRPAFLGAKKFDLVVMSRHDNPAKGKNIAVIEGALNLISDDYLKEQAESLRKQVETRKGFVLGLLIGGDSKDFRLSVDLIREAAGEIKKAVEKLDADILITTSRRTSGEVASLLKEEFGNYPRCRLLIIANERNIPEAVGGILGLSDVIVTTAESISMVSESASAGKYVVVLESADISGKHRSFLELFAEKKYIYPAEAANLSAVIEDIWKNKPKICKPQDRLLLEEAVKRLL